MGHMLLCISDMTQLFLVYSTGLFIRFEGLATARFQTKMDNRMTNHLKTDRFLPDENLPDDGSLCVYFIGKSK